MSTTSWVLISFFSFQLDCCIPVKKDLKCKNNPDRFCYICGKVVFLNRQAKIPDFVKKAHWDYFVVKQVDQNKPFAPHVCWKTFMENLEDWKNGKRKSMPFAIPMVWKGRKDHITNFYFYMINLKGINLRNKHHLQYSNVPSAIRPILHGPDLPVSESDANMEYSSDYEHSDMTVVAGGDAYKSEEEDHTVLLTQSELNDLIQDRKHSKEPVQLLGLHLKDKYLTPGITFYCYRDREKVFHIPR